MSEITVITNLQITKIYKDVPECFDLDKKAWGNGMAEITKNSLDADDVVVTNVQEFVLDENN